MLESKTIHTRYAAGSVNLLNFLNELGYKEYDKIGNGLSVIRTYQLYGRNLWVRVSFNEIDLFTLINGKEVSQFKGFTIHDELLRFFSSREPFQIKNTEDATNL